MTGLLAQHGLALVFANVFLTQAGVPLPAIPMLVVAGAFIQEGQMSAAGVLTVTVAASLLGDTLWFAAVRPHSHPVLCMPGRDRARFLRKADRELFRALGTTLAARGEVYPGLRDSGAAACRSHATRV